MPDEHKYSIYYNDIKGNMKNTNKNNKEIKWDEITTRKIL